MNVVTPYVSIYNDSDKEMLFGLNDGIKLLKKIEYLGRISHRSEEAQSETSWERFLNAVVMTKGDWSIVEHASLTVIFYVDRGITHEIVRHRLASYTQESTRFVNYEKKMPASFIYPEQHIEEFMDEDWVKCIETCEETYKKLIGKGWTPQIARSVLPNALGSMIAMTCNLRNWRHFLLMRTTRETHPQAREVTLPLLGMLQKYIPLLFSDIEPMVTQADNLKKMR